MNADYVIYVVTKRGREWKYLKEGDSWTQATPNGAIRHLSPEQLLSHLLPPLSGDQPNLGVRVERRVKRLKR